MDHEIYIMLAGITEKVDYLINKLQEAEEKAKKEDKKQ